MSFLSDLLNQISKTIVNPFGIVSKIECLNVFGCSKTLSSFYLEFHEVSS